MDGQVNRPKPICPSNFFEVWGITMNKRAMMALKRSPEPRYAMKVIASVE